MIRGNESDVEGVGGDSDCTDCVFTLPARLGLEDSSSRCPPSMVDGDFGFGGLNLGISFCRMVALPWNLRYGFRLRCVNSPMRILELGMVR